ncbi:hypothetical protein CEXT_169291 [Caerostris extrusa]|uniref:Uncharacterized protein n=1 Tax=Caerostris extrusa TaxID=172846 RepID=A0AAV4TML0_CAEEX|nr:hypothetical protein CEXT_169291 [Caerostris extrusa]
MSKLSIFSNLKDLSCFVWQAIILQIFAKQLKSVNALWDGLRRHVLADSYLPASDNIRRRSGCKVGVQGRVRVPNVGDRYGQLLPSHAWLGCIMDCGNVRDTLQCRGEVEFKLFRCVQDLRSTTTVTISCAVFKKINLQPNIQQQSTTMQDFEKNSAIHFSSC